MPLIQATDTQVTQKCAVCLAEHVHDVSSLQLGNAVGNVNEIALPKCTACGAFEMLQRTWDTAPPIVAGSYVDLHRRAVNGLGAVLKAANQVHAAVAASVAAEGAPPPDFQALGSTPVTIPFADPNAPRVAE